MLNYISLSFIILITSLQEGEGYNCNVKPALLIRTERDTSASLPISQSSDPGACSLPNYPENGYWTLYGNNSVFNPGDWVKSSAVLVFGCNTNYKLYPEIGFQFYRLCFNGKWEGTLPKCIRTCFSLQSNERMQVSCKYLASNTSCDNPYTGTEAQIKCNDFYEDPSLLDNPFSTVLYHCIDGNWDRRIPICRPDCGHKSVNPTKLIVNGANTLKSEYPWQAVIYLKKVHICGGSIISTNLILTAAHCFETTEWNHYQVGVGKFYRQYDNKNDIDSAQYLNVQHVKIRQEFYDGTYLAYDIALVVLASPLKITFGVRPICLDQNLFDDSSFLNKTGIITGWGYTTEDGNPSDELKKLEVKYYTTQDCKATLPLNSRAYYIPNAADKMCAGVLNKNESACQGDDGGGLYFKENGRYYIRGVMSVGPYKANAVCDSSKLSLYTSVEFHNSFIMKELKQHSKIPIESDACSLLNYPEYGYWNVLGFIGFKPGQWTKPGTILQFECEEKYKLYPEIYSESVCNNGSWGNNLPKCIKTCSSLFSHEKMKVSCKYRGKETSCDNPYTGTEAVIKCNDFYEDPIDHETTTTRHCLDGVWDKAIPICQPECGRKSVNPTKLIINGMNTEKSEYPWQAAIYLKKYQICGGTIISTKLILSAAHCLSKRHPSNNYQVGVGKLYRQYDHKNDVDSAQYSEVQEVKIQPEYNPDSLDYDIALVILANPLNITFDVRPICLDRNPFQDSSLAHKNGIITGWGYTTGHGNVSEVLKKMEVEYYTTRDCQAKLPLAFKHFYTPYVPDKMCAGTLNNQSGCPGDSGGGLYFKEGGRYYIRGVMSFGPTKANLACDASKPTLCTSIDFHRGFILQELKKYSSELQQKSSIQQPQPLATITTTTTTTTTTPRTVSIVQKPDSHYCILPEHPKNGKWSIADKAAVTKLPGQEVEEETLIQFECDVGYKFYPEYNETYLYKVCRKSKWGFLPECRKICESRISTDRLRITCDLDGSNVSCINPYVGTIAKMECAPFYQNPSFRDPSSRKHYCLDNGWEYHLPICEPECGITSVQPKRLIVGGNETISGEYPWQVAIFLDEGQVCGGSIISQRIVLSAGHCFDFPDELERYQVAAGKLHRTYNHARDNHAQYSSVKKIEVGELDSHFRGDIAVVILEQPFQLTTYVRPVCFDGEYFSELQLRDQIGIVTGWGYTSETGNSSEVLKELHVNYFTRTDCISQIRDDFEQYYSYDKICAGVLTKDENVCRGDSGGPLVFKFESRYYIRGIVSISASKPNAQCDVASLAFYTSVNFHRRYIEKFLRLYRT